MGLETRGLRPDPQYRGELAVFIHQELDREMRLAIPYISYELIHGIPCGPTLPPKDLVGIRILFPTVDRVTALKSATSQEPQAL